MKARRPDGPPCSAAVGTAADTAEDAHEVFTQRVVGGVSPRTAAARFRRFRSGGHAHEHHHPDVVLEGRASGDSWRAPRTTGADSTREAGSRGISTTLDNQILLELLPADTALANLFDLNGRTLVFTPDGHGGYSRSVQSVAWEDDIGQPVADGEEIHLQRFTFDFAGSGWGSFFVSRHGLITFGEPLAYDYWLQSRFDPMSAIAAEFVTTPTISPLFKPVLGGREDTYGATQHVALGVDQVVVTWATSEPIYYEHGVPPERPVRFQLILRADGTVRFSYADVYLGDGIVGLFQHDDITKSDLIVAMADERDPELAGHLDLLNVAIYATSDDSIAILEFLLRESIPDPDDHTWYSYRIYFDVDRPWWETEWYDLDNVWQIDIGRWARGERTVSGDGVIGLLRSDSSDRIALLADTRKIQGIPVSIRAGTAEFHRDRSVAGDSVRSPVLLELPPAPRVDLSQPSSRYSLKHQEVFHYRSAPNTVDIACRVIGELGDEFDLLVFHSEFRTDSQESASPWNGYSGNVGVEGVGNPSQNVPPCDAGRLKGHWARPVLMNVGVVDHSARSNNRTPFDGALVLFAHEFTHAWTAALSFDRNGEVERLFDDWGHWRPDLHVPTVFPWRETEACYMSLMGGGPCWSDNGDGTFTPHLGYHDSGPSWLDLYAMGLADASEVPDMFILRNARPVNEGDRWGPHIGDKEIVSIEQVVAVEGPRAPSATEAQKDFNAGFVYLLEPGQTPDPDLLRLHRDYRDKVIDHWSHITGGRSRMATTVPSVANRSPAAVGTLADQVLHVDGRAVVEVAGAFRDPDGDPLTYEAASSAPPVATVAVSGSTLTVRALAAGTATVTVTATDAGGSNTAATVAFRVTVRVRARATFTDDPIVPGVTPVKAVHFTELRDRIDLLRRATGLEPFSWTDPVLTAGATPVRLAHLRELRGALGDAYGTWGRDAPTYTDAAPTGSTPIRAVHLTELRAAVVALE